MRERGTGSIMTLLHIRGSYAYSSQQYESIKLVLRMHTRSTATGVTRIQGLCTLHTLHTLHTLLVGDFNTVRLYEFSSQYSTQLMIILIILLQSSRVCIIILLLGVRARIMHNSSYYKYTTLARVRLVIILYSNILRSRILYNAYYESYSRVATSVEY